MIERHHGAMILYGLRTMAGDAAKLHIYTSPMPAVGGGAVGSAVKLAEIVLASPIGSITQDATHHVLTYNISSPDLFADASGTCGWARLTTANDDWVADFDITLTGGGGAITTPRVIVNMGEPITLMDATIKVPL